MSVTAPGHPSPGWEQRSVQTTPRNPLQHSPAPSHWQQPTADHRLSTQSRQPTGFQTIPTSAPPAVPPTSKPPHRGPSPARDEQLPHFTVPGAPPSPSAGRSVVSPSSASPVTLDLTLFPRRRAASGPASSHPAAGGGGPSGRRLGPRDAGRAARCSHGRREALAAAAATVFAPLIGRRNDKLTEGSRAETLRPDGAAADGGAAGRHYRPSGERRRRNERPSARLHQWPAARRAGRSSRAGPVPVAERAHGIAGAGSGRPGRRGAAGHIRGRLRQSPASGALLTPCRARAALFDRGGGKQRRGRRKRRRAQPPARTESRGRLRRPPLLRGPPANSVHL